LQESDACLSCLPYYYTDAATQIAIEAKCHINDLGGNTDIVKEQLKLTGEAIKNNISVVPDCGLAPGAVNILTHKAINSMKDPMYAKIVCGGLPQNYKLPLGYKKTFSIDGLLNEYSHDCLIVRNGKVDSVPALDHCLEFFVKDSDIHYHEMFPTSGGSSLCPYDYEGVLKSYDYYTLRYPGHYNFFKGLKDLDMMDESFANELSWKLDFPEEKDLIRFYIDVTGKDKTIKMELLEKQDEHFTAMEKTTAFSAAMITVMQAQGLVNPGVNKLTQLPCGIFYEMFNECFDLKVETK